MSNRKRNKKTRSEVNNICTHEASIRQCTAFTLVELIVVIVILAILATIAFLSFNSYSSSARDSTRLSDLSSIAKGLNVNNVSGGKYPIPDFSVTITSGTGILGYQGNAGDSILRIIKGSSPGYMDPLDNKHYTYNTNLSQNKYQLLAFLEKRDSVAFDINPFLGITASATDYPGRYPYEIGNNLGVILSLSGTIYTPLQDTGTGIDISVTTSDKQTIIDNSDNVTGVPSALKQNYSSLLVFTGITKGSDITPETDIFNLTDDQIRLIFDGGSPYVTGWSGGVCDTSFIHVVTKTDFSSQYRIPENTILKIPNGTYELNGATGGGGYLSFSGNCSAIIGESPGGVKLNGAFSTGAVSGLGIVGTSAKSNNIIANIDIVGDHNSSNRYSYNLYLGGGKNISVRNVNSYSGTTGVWLNSISYMNADNLKATNSYSHGIYANSSYYASFSNTEISYNNRGNFSNIYGSYFENSTGMTMRNTKIFGNNYIGLMTLASHNMIFEDVQIYKNGTYGYRNYNCSNGYFKDVLFYNNGSVGLGMEYGSSNNMIINSQFFSNGGAGLSLFSSSNNVFSNISSYNNLNEGVKLSNANNSTFHNSRLHSNNYDGLYLYGNSSNNTLNKNFIANNGGYGIRSSATTNLSNRYYGEILNFGNNQGALNGTNGNDAYFAGGLQSDLSAIGFTGGSITTTGTMSCAYHPQPNTVSSWGATCTDRSWKVTGVALPVPGFNYGASIGAQEQPLICPVGQNCANGANLQLYGVSGKDWDGTKKIGER